MPIHYRHQISESPVHRQDVLEEIFLNKISDFVFDEHQMKQYLGGISTQIEDKKKEIEHIIKSKEEQNSKLNALIDLYQNGHLTKKSFSDRAVPIEEQLLQLQEVEAILHGEIDHLKILELQTSDVTDSAQDIASSWNKYDEITKRRIAENVIEKITVDKEEIDISLYSIPYEYSNKSVSHPP